MGDVCLLLFPKAQLCGFLVRHIPIHGVIGVLIKKSCWGAGEGCHGEPPYKIGTTPLFVEGTAPINVTGKA